MTYPECVKFAFASFWKAADTIVFAIGNKIVASAGEYFVAISLVTNVPHQLVVRSVVNVMKSCCQFDHTKTGAKVTAMHTDHINDILPELITNLVQFFTG